MSFLVGCTFFLSDHGLRCLISQPHVLFLVEPVCSFQVSIVLGRLRLSFLDWISHLQLGMFKRCTIF